MRTFRYAFDHTTGKFDCFSTKATIILSDMSTIDKGPFAVIAGCACAISASLVSASLTARSYVHSTQGELGPAHPSGSERCDPHSTGGACVCVTWRRNSVYRRNHAQRLPRPGSEPAAVSFLQLGAFDRPRQYSPHANVALPGARSRASAGRGAATHGSRLDLSRFWDMRMWISDVS